MKKLFTLALIATACTAAMAKEPAPTPAPVSAAQASAIAAAVAVAMQAQKQLQHQHAQAISGGNTLESTTTVQAQERDPVSTAYAPSLAAHNCLGSASGGAQGAAFGFSIGSTKVDPGCDARADADALSRMGKPRAALARLCQREDIAKAIVASGEQCPAPVSPSPAVKTACAAYSGPDPIVIERNCGG